MIRNNYLILTALLAMQAPQVADAQTKQWTLRECEDYAVAHNITIKQREVAREKQTYTLSTARNSRLPDLTGSVGQNFNFGRGLTEDNIYENTNTTSTNFQLNTSIPLFTGFQIPENIKLSRLNLEALTEDLEKAKNDIRMQVAQAYVQILYDEEMSAVAQRQIAIDSMQVARLRAFVENGKASVSELSQQEATLASSRLTATQADNKRLISLLTLTQLLELPTPEGFAIVSPNVEKVASVDGLMTPDDIYLEAIGFKPEIRSEELRLKGTEHSINIAKAGHYPKLNLNAGLSTNYNTISDFESESFGDQLRHKFAQFVGLNLSIPIFNRFQVRNNIRSAKADRHNQMLKLESVKKTLYKEIQQAYYNMVAAQQKLHSSSQARHSAADAFQLMSAKYELGNATITEFNESKNTYLKAESDLTQARYEYLFQHALILFYRGKELKF